MKKIAHVYTKINGKQQYTHIPTKQGNIEKTQSHPVKVFLDNAKLLKKMTASLEEETNKKNIKKQIKKRKNHKNI